MADSGHGIQAGSDSEILCSEPAVSRATSKSLSPHGVWPLQPASRAGREHSAASLPCSLDGRGQQGLHRLPIINARCKGMELQGPYKSLASASSQTSFWILPLVCWRTGPLAPVHQPPPSSLSILTTDFTASLLLPFQGSVSSLQWRHQQPLRSKHAPQPSTA